MMSFISSTTLGSSTLTGTRYFALNQDAVITDEIVSTNSEPAFLAIVLDGHGMLGELVADAAGKAILAHLKNSLHKPISLADLPASKIETIFERAFEVGHQAALTVYENAPQRYIYPIGSPQAQEFSLITRDDGVQSYHHPHLGCRLIEFGSTATAVLVQGRKAVIAHVGDSLAVLGRDHIDEDLCGEFLTRRHFAGDPEESIRLKETCGDKVAIIGKEQYLAVCDGVKPSLSLAMTRALGHRLMADYGVIPLPDIKILDLDVDEHTCLIAASDGVWDSMSASHAVRCVQETIAQGRSVEDAAYVLCRECVDQIKHADNTSAAVFVFEKMLTPSSSSGEATASDDG